MENLTGIFDSVEEALKNISTGEEVSLLSKIISLVIIIALTYAIIRIGDFVINKYIRGKYLAKEYRTKAKHEAQRKNTIIRIAQNAFRWIVIFIAFVTAMDNLGLPIMTILSTAGIVGIAVAFGAQSLFKDIITGFFILLENQYNVGEMIEAQGVSGYVENVTLRCTYLRDIDGSLHILPNGNMALVTNKNRGGSRALVNIGVSYDSNIDKVMEALTKACEKVNEENSEIIVEKPMVQGIEVLNESSMDFRIVGIAQANKAMSLKMAINKACKEALDEAGIEIPYPTTKVYLKKE